MTPAQALYGLCDGDITKAESVAGMRAETVYEWILAGIVALKKAKDDAAAEAEQKRLEQGAENLG